MRIDAVLNKKPSAYKIGNPIQRAPEDQHKGPCENRANLPSSFLSFEMRQSARFETCCGDSPFYQWFYICLSPLALLLATVGVDSNLVSINIDVEIAVSIGAIPQFCGFVTPVNLTGETRVREVRPVGVSAFRSMELLRRRIQ
jgi:hypothetical protein